MDQIAFDDAPALHHVEPVLAVKSVADTVAYYQSVLGFPDKWIFDPPTMGGVGWQGVSIQFSEEPRLAAMSAGNSIWISMRNIDQLYAFHQQNGANIVDPLQVRTSGFTQYTLRDINGYYVNFAARALQRNTKADAPSFRIVNRLPTIAEQTRIAQSIAWVQEGEEMTRTAEESIACATVAEDTNTGEAIGCAFAVGAKDSFYYIREVMVMPAYQGHRVGTALVQGLIDWLKANASHKATVGLFTGEHLAGFYKQFNFFQACGMYRQLGDL